MGLEGYYFFIRVSFLGLMTGYLMILRRQAAIDMIFTKAGYWAGAGCFLLYIYIP